MGSKTGIKWTDHTFNPWWGCQKVSPGCAHCYAEGIASRFHGEDRLWGPNHAIRPASERQWAETSAWNMRAQRDGVRRRVFCASMADVWEQGEGQEEGRQRLWNAIDATPWLDWQLLTKRPENIALPSQWAAWPRNVWLMTSVESPRYTNRIDTLLQHNAVVRGLSCEPQLEALDLRPWLSQLQWVIVGGESGPNARPMQAEWVRNLRDQCASAGVAFFFKQWGGRAKGNELDGRIHEVFPEVKHG